MPNSPHQLTVATTNPGQPTVIPASLERIMDTALAALAEHSTDFIGIAALEGQALLVNPAGQQEEQLRATSAQLRALMASLRSAREQEGTRIAREIHDEFGSALTSLRWDLEEIDTTISEAVDLSGVPRLRGKIGAMLGLIDMTIHVVRRIASELRPSVLDNLGLAAALEWQAQQFQGRTGIMCRYNGAGEHLVLDQEQATAIFRIFQEALTNVLRHAQATRVDIMLEEKGTALLLTIRDNGRGMTEDESQADCTLSGCWACANVPTSLVPGSISPGSRGKGH